MNVSRFFLLLSLIGLSLEPSRAAESKGTPLAISEPAQLQKSLDAAIQSGIKKVVIPPGIYRISGPDQKERSWHLQFKDLRDLEIDATGATLIFTNPVHSGILFSNCHNVTFRGARIQREPLPFSQGTIEALDPKGDYLDLRVDAGYPDQLDDRILFPTFWSSLFSATGKDSIWTVRANTPPEIRRLGPGLFRIMLYDKIPSIEVPVKPGMKLAWRGNVKDDIRPMNCSGMKFMGITVAGGNGMVFHEMGGAGGNLYRDCSITYPPRPPGATADSLQSTSADGLHSHDMEKGPVVENCLFEGIGDDGVAIHGTYAMVDESLGNRIIVRVFHETRDNLYCRAGETLRFYDSKGLPAGESIVAEVKRLPDHKSTFRAGIVYRPFQESEKHGFIEVTLKEKVSLKPGDLISNSNRTGNGYIVRNSIFRHSIARGVMPKAADGLIEGNTFENLSRAGVELMSEMEVWSESDYSRNVIIRNNTFRNVSFNRRDGYLRHPGAVTVFNFRAVTEDLDLSKRQGRYVPAPGGHRNILIENNRFENVDGPNLLITSASGVTVQKNRFIRPMLQDKKLGSSKGIHTEALVWLTECRDIQMSGNTIEEPGPYLKKNVEASDSAGGMGFENGFTPATTSPSQP